jgi:hypothetical protein
MDDGDGDGDGDGVGGDSFVLGGKQSARTPVFIYQHPPTIELGVGLGITLRISIQSWSRFYCPSPLIIPFFLAGFGLGFRFGGV